MKIIKIQYADKNYPQNLLKIKKPPKILYAIGNVSLLNKPSISIVGSRKSTQYGEKYAIKLSNEISNAGICIVSGLAMGIDTCAHLGAINTQGKTIAVLGTSFSNIYPKENIPLLKSIIKSGGCVITENTSNEVDLSKFPQRNRIISGLSMATLIIEAAYRSGSSITARYALEQGKKLFCLPRNIEEKNGVGTNNLLKKGAQIVTTSKEILQKLNITNKFIKECNANDIEKIQYLKCTKNEIDIETNSKNIPTKYQKIYNVIKNNPMNINDISRKTGLKITQVNALLTMMEIEKYVKSLPANEFISI